MQNHKLPGYFDFFKMATLLLVIIAVFPLNMVSRYLIRKLNVYRFKNDSGTDNQVSHRGSKIK